jgi:hypothetical protein
LSISLTCLIGLNEVLHKGTRTALQDRASLGREARNRGCALPRYTQKVWESRPHRLMKDQSTSPIYYQRVDLHKREEVLQFPLLEGANSECLSKNILPNFSLDIKMLCVSAKTQLLNEAIGDLLKKHEA